jgi:hypothetical protein
MQIHGPVRILWIGNTVLGPIPPYFEDTGIEDDWYVGDGQTLVGREDGYWSWRWHCESMNAKITKNKYEETRGREWKGKKVREEERYKTTKKLYAAVRKKNWCCNLIQKSGVKSLVSELLGMAWLVHSEQTFVQAGYHSMGQARLNY